MLELLVQPGPKGLVEDPFGPRFGEHLEQRIDPRFDRPFAQEIGAEAVNGAHVRFLEPLDRVGEAVLHPGVRGALPQALELFADAQLELSCRFLGKRDRDDLFDPGAPHASTFRIRETSSVVLPVPAAASTITVSSRPSRMRVDRPGRTTPQQSRLPPKGEEIRKRFV